MRLLILATALAIAAFPQQPARPSRPQNFETGWVSLFNGKDLTGWVKIGNEKWTVEDGVIHGQGVTKEYGYLKTEKNYKDFELSLRFKCEADGNSGVFFHAEFKPGTATITQGMQFEIDRGLNHHTGGLYGDGRAVDRLARARERVRHQAQRLERLCLIVAGNRYQCRLNGVWVVDFTDPTPESFDGGIALQLHSGGAGQHAVQGHPPSAT